MQSAEATIIAPTAGYVKTDVSAPHVRVMHDSIAAKDIKPETRAKACSQPLSG